MQGSVASAYWREFKFLTILAVIILFAGCERGSTVSIHTAQGEVPIRVEIADSPELRMQGLMYRTNLGADAGMLFLFPKESEQSFWMKNTPTALDMIFINSARQIVGIVNNTQPFSLTPRSVGIPSRYVLEVHAGFAAKHGIAAGQAVEFKSIPSDPST